MQAWCKLASVSRYPQMSTSPEAVMAAAIWLRVTKIALRHTQVGRVPKRPNCWHCKPSSASAVDARHA